MNQTQHTTLAESLTPTPDQADRWLKAEEPITFEEAAELVSATAAADGTRRDVVTTDLRSWAFATMNGETMALAQVPFRGRAKTAPLELREHAFGQLCQRIGAPAPYIRRLPAKLQVACMNYGLTRERRPALLRQADGELRAVLSDRYAAFDDAALLEMVGEQLDRLGYRHDVSVRALSTGKTMLMRLTLPGEGQAVQKDDIIEYGIDIANSELGLRSVQITPVTYRLVCTNGMRAWRSDSAIRMRHVGDPQRLQEQLRDAIPVAFAEARGDLDRWKRAVDMMIDDTLREIEGLRSFGLSVAETRQIEGELNRQHGTLVLQPGRAPTKDVSVFDVANAITAVAKTSSSTSARLTMEEFGHRYLSSRAG